MLGFTICFATTLARRHAAVIAAMSRRQTEGRQTEELLAYGLIMIHRQLHGHRAPAMAAQLQVRSCCTDPNPTQTLSLTHILTFTQLHLLRSSCICRSPATLHREWLRSQPLVTCSLCCPVQWQNGCGDGEGMLAVQELLRINGAMMTMLRGFAAGSPGMTTWAYPAITLARTAVRLLGCKPAPATVNAGLTRTLSTALLQAAGQARPCSRLPL